ncbi:Pre-mRNA-processing-splicing factor 8B [Bienertia sinuspersici]
MILFSSYCIHSWFHTRFAFPSCLFYPVRPSSIVCGGPFCRSWGVDFLTSSSIVVSGCEGYSRKSSPFSFSLFHSNVNSIGDLGFLIKQCGTVTILWRHHRNRGRQSLRCWQCNLPIKCCNCHHSSSNRSRLLKLRRVLRRKIKNGCNSILSVMTIRGSYGFVKIEEEYMLPEHVQKIIRFRDLPLRPPH